MTGINEWVLRRKGVLFWFCQASLPVHYRGVDHNQEPIGTKNYAGGQGVGEKKGVGPNVPEGRYWRYVGAVESRFKAD